MNWKVTLAFVVLAGHAALVECFNNSSSEDINTTETNCVNSSLSEFPEDLFDEYQRKHGALILHFILTVYCFIVLAIVCDKYFLPSVECICIDLNLSQDVAGATFMAVATSTPELFTNIIGTFITESDLGVGTVVGAAIFNTLGIVSCIGLAACKVIPLEWWPMTRDCSIYMISLAALTIITLDERIEWYEALVLIFMYIMYFLIMYANKDLLKIVNKIVVKFSGSTTEIRETDEPTVEVYKSVGPGRYRWYLHGEFKASIKKAAKDLEKADPNKGKEIKENEKKSTCISMGTVLKYLLTAFMWPIKFLLCISIPDCRKDHLRRLYPITFIMCIIWIGVSSYLNSWMMTIIGSTIGVPDSVMGLTVLAAGGSLPEMFSSIIMARQGIGVMGVSSSVGANTLNILLCLGLPWFIKCIVDIANTGDPSISYVQIMSTGVTYNCFALLISVVILYSIVVLFRFQLGKRLGYTCLALYFICITLAILSELNVFFHVNDPVCS